MATGVLLVAMIGLLAPGDRGIRPGESLAPDTVVARVRNADKAVPDALRADLRAARADPGNLAAAQRAARGLIAEGRATGDSRLVGASIGLLRPFLADPDPQTLLLAATARQYQHDFPGALALLDQALALDPQEVNARLTRATIRTVQGDYPAASADCAAISAQAQVQLGFLCQSTVLLLTDKAPLVATRLTAILQAGQLPDPVMAQWATGLLGEIAALQGDRAAARRYLGQVLAADPLALRERLILTDLALADRAPADAMALLAGQPETDGVLIRRVLAQTQLGTATGDDRAELARRVQLNLDLGLTAHAREEARYFLEIAGDPVQALARARVNWALQHEIEDAQLLIDAAAAAGAPAVAAPVLAWMAAQGVVVPALTIPDAVRKAAE